MIGNPKTGTLKSTISGNVNTGFTVTAPDGRRAHLAIVSEDGEIIEAGPSVAREAWNVCLQVQRNFWIGKGHITVHSSLHAPLKMAS